MLHPLIATLIQRPDLVIDHACGYAELLSQEARAAGSQVLKRTVAGLLAVACGSICVALTGMAVMLGFLLNQFHWSLIAVPAAALVLTIVAAIEARKPLPADYFPELKAQVDSDAQALRAAV